MIAGLSGGFGFPAIVELVSPSASVPAPAFSLLGVLAIAVAVVVTRLRSTVGWRVAVLVAAGLLLDLASTYPLGVGDLTAIVVLLLGSLLGAVLVWPVAIASWRGRVRRASRGVTGGPGLPPGKAPGHPPQQHLYAIVRLTCTDKPTITNY